MGTAITLEPFSKAECAKLNDLYGAPLDTRQLEDFWRLSRGQLYLTREGFHRLAFRRMDFEVLMKVASEDHGPFGDHLRSMLMKLHQSAELLNAMKQIIAGKACDDDAYYRLSGAGFVVRDDDRINPANLLYARYFRKAI